MDKEVQKETEMYTFWNENIRSFQFSHTTSSIIAEQILKEGLDPKKRQLIFEKAKKLNALLGKYSCFGCFSQAPEVFERKYFFVSPLRLYAEYKVPEVIDHLIVFTESAMKSLTIVFQSRGKFGEFARLNENRRNIYTTKDNFEKIPFEEFKVDFEMIQLLLQELKEFERQSTSTTLLIDNQALSGFLPKELEETFSTFASFKKRYALGWPLTRPSDVSQHVISILGTNEIRVTKKIPPQFIHVMKK